VNLSASRLPANAQEILDRRPLFAQQLVEAKKEPLPLELTWYPYDSMASIEHITPFLQRHFSEFERAFRSGPVIDFGCGDGEIPLFFASLGCKVAAADNRRSNHNWMAGVRALRDRLNLPVEIHELNADTATGRPVSPEESLPGVRDAGESVPLLRFEYPHRGRDEIRCAHEE
jgi:hypothetical protein